MQTQKSIDNNQIPPALDRLIDEITADMSKVCGKNLRTLSLENLKMVVNYVIALKTEVNLSTHYKKDIIDLLTKFGLRYNFKDVTRDDVVAFLDSFRKPESVDPLHKWIGTSNIYRVHLIRFFKWFFAPDIERTKRPKPAVVDNIPELKRKEKSIYKPSDLWTPEDDLLFLKYCPSKRDKCYHAISRDLSARPHEILKLKIRDISFKTVPSGRQYVEVVVNGKTGTRPIPLINSIPYLKDYLDHEHPMPNNPNAPLICGVSKSLGRHLTNMRIGKIYCRYKDEIFPKLLDLPTTLPEDKQRIRELLKKAWNPYIRRHSALTEKSMMLREHVLRQHAGWSPASNMHLKYLHYFGNESSESLLEEYGLIEKGAQLNPLQPKICPNCNEGNKPDAKFCLKCRFVLAYDAYNETIQQQERDSHRLEMMEQQNQELRNNINKVMEMIQQDPKLAQVKPEVLTEKIR